MLGSKRGHVEYAVYVTNYDNLCHYKSGVGFDVRHLIIIMHVVSMYHYVRHATLNLNS